MESQGSGWSLSRGYVGLEVLFGLFFGQDLGLRSALTESWVELD